LDAPLAAQIHEELTSRVLSMSARGLVDGGRVLDPALGPRCDCLSSNRTTGQTPVQLEMSEWIRDDLSLIAGGGVECRVPSCGAIERLDTPSAGAGCVPHDARFVRVPGGNSLRREDQRGRVARQVLAHLTAARRAISGRDDDMRRVARGKVAYIDVIFIAVSPGTLQGLS
jgi:hypothetical protein